MNSKALLELLHLADSALPIGGAAHSFGLESLIDTELLHSGNLEEFFSGYLEETGALEASYCARSCELARIPAMERWYRLNTELGARKLAREPRDASAAMGRRFVQLAANITGHGLLLTAASETREVHLAASFGFVAGALDLDAEIASAAYLQQSITTLIACCQRLLPLGQTHAHQILWNLKPAILRAASGSDTSFTPLLDCVAARHATLRTRLFIS
ncbi:MAG TPA: urease accessory UreF family protein [Bryobacteraceae bacterium]|nr:urease accessory UreF family protein [Bryobacteraceae bacterium]